MTKIEEKHVDFGRRALLFFIVAAPAGSVGLLKVSDESCVIRLNVAERSIFSILSHRKKLVARLLVYLKQAKTENHKSEKGEWERERRLYYFIYFRLSSNNAIYIVLVFAKHCVDYIGLFQIDFIEKWKA